MCNETLGILLIKGQGIHALDLSRGEMLVDCSPFPALCWANGRVTVLIAHLLSGRNREQVVNILLILFFHVS